MRVINGLISSILVIFFIVSISLSQTACTKTEVEHDTTIKNIHDTTIKNIHDTTVVIDTFYNLNYGLVAYYNFTNGNLNDSSGNHNNILFNNAVVTADRFGRAGNAYNFTGGAYMRVPNSASLSPIQITMMAIVRFHSYYTGAAWGNEIFMKGPSDPTNGVYGLRVHPTSFDYSTPLDTTKENFLGFYGDGANAGIVDSSFRIHGGDWNTVVYTYDGFFAKIYVNGILRGTNSVPFGFNANANDLYIGKTENPSYPYYMDGDIDEIRIYNRAVSPFFVTKLNAVTE
jgi:hypothetical protein